MLKSRRIPILLHKNDNYLTVKIDLYVTVACIFQVHLVVKVPVVGTDCPRSKLETELRKILKEHFR